MTAWIDEVVAAYDDADRVRFEDGFDKRDVISAVEIFGEPMRGVWVWRKPSILPHLTLGWAMVDPRTTETFAETDAVWIS